VVSFAPLQLKPEGKISKAGWAPESASILRKEKNLASAGNQTPSVQLICCSYIHPIVIWKYAENNRSPLGLSCLYNVRFVRKTQGGLPYAFICEGNVSKSYRPMHLTVKERGTFHCRLELYSPLHVHGRNDVKAVGESRSAIN
jgi:hypothetical protein